VIESFNEVLAYRDVSRDRLTVEVDRFCTLLKGVPDEIKMILVPTWTVPSCQRGLGLIDMKGHGGIALSLMRMNLCLAECLADDVRTFVLAADRWINTAGNKGFDPRLWYLSKTPFSNEVFKEAAGDVKAAIRAVAGQAKKVIIVDLDETLWGGIMGDLGWQNIRLGGHDAIGEAYADFQRSLKRLSGRGILLGIVSKNEEELALEAIKNHPEMVLKLDDFAGWRINWQDKAQNIVELISDLNLGIDSAVFIDDNPVERARVREALPEVMVPEWPCNPIFYTTALLKLNCFDIPSVSSEDRSRTSMYVSERKRKQLSHEVGSLGEWLKTLELIVKVEELNEANLERAAQLLNKTNQMNLSTRRMTKKELRDWASSRQNKFWTFRVSDKFGDSGLTGIASLSVEDRTGRIIDFILSCRVMGRGVEEAMLSIVIQEAKNRELKEVYVRHIPTSKNVPCKRFLEHSKLERVDSHTFRWNLERPYEPPDGLTIEYLPLLPEFAKVDK
jgi:FkbH-like protein